MRLLAGGRGEFISHNTREDALLYALFYVADFTRFWANKAEKYPAHAHGASRTHSPFVWGTKVIVRHRSV